MLSNMKQSIRICFYNFSLWFTNPRVYVAFIIAAIIAWSGSDEYCKLFMEYDIPYNIMEPFIVMFSDFYILSFSVLGILILFCDAPFINAGTPFLLIRSNRNNWIIGQVLYILIGTLIYYIFIMLIIILTRGNNAFLANIWSENSQIIVNNNISLYAGMGLIVNNMSPIMAFSSSLFLIWAYTALLSLLIFMINLFKGKFIAFSIVCAVHVLGYLAQFADYGIIQFISPVINARLEFHDFGYNNYLPSLPFSLVFFIIVISLIIIVLLITAKKIIFNATNEFN